MGCNSSIPVELDPMIMKSDCEHDIFSEEVIILPNGSKRNMTRWIPTSNHVKAIVLLAHGVHEHSLVCDKVCHAFTSKDVACFGIDMLGHGLSDGVRGLITDYRVLPSDLASLASLLRSKPEFQHLPIFIYAHSLGTLVTMLALQEIPNVTAAIFVGTALHPGYAAASPFGIKALYPVTKTSFGRGVARVTSSIDPKGPAGPILVSEISNSEEFLTKREHDGRCYHGQTMNKSAFEILKLIEAAKSAVPTIKIPFLAIHGKIDQITLVSSAQYLHDHSGTDKTKKSLVIIEEAKHHPDYEVMAIANDFVNQVANYVDSFLMDSLTLRDIEVNTMTAVTADNDAAISA